MTLVTKEWTLAGGSSDPSSPQLILASALLVKRQIFLRADSSIYLNNANSNSDGFRVSLSGAGSISFALPAGDALYAWCIANSSGTISLLSSTELLGI